MWNCANCGRPFANRNQSHACSALGDLDRHFRGKDPVVRATFDRMLEEAEKLGPITLLPEKTRIALQVRMSFAAFSPRRRWLDGHVVLDHRLHSPRFRRVETYSPRNVLHAFRLGSPAEVDAEVISWLAEAYAVGEQRHLESSGGSP
jgi:Domain of unknown function (DUF5655)